jgi:16S rRNA (guanine966-N2)-methyltransferase
MRIIAGEWRGRPLVAPEGEATRPTSDRTREGLFSMLASRLGSFEGLRAADLFAGTGALGMEALSRGAAHCTFVDSDRNAIAAVTANLARFGAAARADIRSQRVEHVPPPPIPCDLVFLDPPYETSLTGVALARLVDPAWVAPGGFVSVETKAGAERFAIPSCFEAAAERRFGKAQINLLRRL